MRTKDERDEMAWAGGGGGGVQACAFITTSGAGFVPLHTTRLACRGSTAGREGGHAVTTAAHDQVWCWPQLAPAVGWAGWVVVP